MNCKTCNKEKKKIPCIKKSGNRFVDENNKLWNGKVCPDCYKIYNRERMRLKRLEVLIKD